MRPKKCWWQFCKNDIVHINIDGAKSRHIGVTSQFERSMDNMLSAHEGVDAERKASNAGNTLTQA